MNKRNEIIYIDIELALPMYGARPYFPLKKLGKEVLIICSKLR